MHMLVSAFRATALAVTILFQEQLLSEEFDMQVLLPPASFGYDWLVVRSVKRTRAATLLAP